MTDFTLQAHLDHLYYDQPRRLAFQAESLDAFETWKQELRAEVLRLLGLTGRQPPANPQAERLQSVDRGAYVEEKYALDVGESVAAPMFILIPKAEPPYKAIMAFHGHGPGVQSIISGDGFARGLALAGYLVCAVEQRGFGERVTDQRSGPTDERSCRHLAFEYMMEGRSLLGERCWDGMVAISYVKNRPDIVPDTLGCTGHSGGGTAALWLGAIEPRITVNVVESYFCSFKQSILGVEHCECNYVPGILPLAEMGELGALFAPRPLRIVSGEQDPIFPVEGVRQQFETVKRAYALWDAADGCAMVIHPGGHTYDLDAAVEWFGAYL